jgi:PRC-barrel domain
MVETMVGLKIIALLEYREHAAMHSSPRRNVSSGPLFSILQIPTANPNWRKTMSLEADETGNLIGSDKVEGTAVYGADSSKIGSIERVMIDKRSGKVSYAVLSFGGFLGIGDDHYPLPWQSLKYDTSLGGYVTGVTEAQLKNAPHYRNDNTWNWSDPTRTRAVNDYYGVAI